VNGPLAVVEADDAWLVTRAEDPADWLVAFEKAEGADARTWAESMRDTYNRRLVPAYASTVRPSASRTEHDDGRGQPEGRALSATADGVRRRSFGGEGERSCGSGY
jgi:hypothetical protein